MGNLVDCVKGRSRSDYSRRRIAVELEIVKDLLSLGRAATKKKYGLTDSKLELVVLKVDRRIANQSFARETVCGRAPEVALRITECPITTCSGLSVVAGSPCGHHYKPLVMPVGERQYNQMIKGILRTYQLRLGWARKRRKNEIKVDQLIYTEIINFIINLCLAKHRSLASQYYTRFDDNLVDMATKLGLDSTKPVKKLLVEIGVEIGGILRGLENMHMKRFDQDAEDWAEQGGEDEQV